MTTAASTTDRTAIVNTYTAAGMTLFPCGAPPEGKAPKFKRWRHTEYDPCLYADQLPPIYGVLLTDDLCVVDYDPRRDTDDSPKQLKALWKALSLPAADTFVVKTGSGGLHLYFRKPAGMKLRATVPGYPAIDIKTIGGYVIAAGSLHHSGATYTVARGTPDELMDLPEDLLKRIAHTGIPASTTGVCDDSEAAKYRFRQYAFQVEPQYEQGGGLHTVKVAMEGRDYGLSEGATLEIMLDVFNPRCTPPWTEGELALKVRNAYEYGKNVAGVLHPAAEYADVEPVEPPTRKTITGKERSGMKWDFTKAGDVAPTISNIVNYFHLDSVGPRKGVPNPLLGLVRYNLFSDRVEFIRPAPWHGDGERPAHWTDGDTIQLKMFLNDMEHFTCFTPALDEGVMAAALLDKYHPVRNWLQTLTWDGVARLDRLLIDYAGAGDVPEVREFGKNTLIAAVARIINPGCQHDSMLVLEGQQGSGKTNFVRTLGGEWFADVHLDPKNKDTVAAMCGVWILEASEMTVTKQTDVDSLKRFLTIKSDRMRPAYGRHTKDFPRQSIFIGTVNYDPNEGSGGYLRDATGNRRFWPVATTTIDIPALKRDRDQLFAEALVRYNNGEQYHLTDPDMIARANKATSERLITDAWEDIIGNWIAGAGDKTPEYLNTEMVAYGALNLPPARLNQMETRRICSAMRKIGYESKMLWHPELRIRVRCWMKED